MTISSVNGTNTQMVQMGMNQAEDSYSRSIQNQIANAQKQMQDLSSNEDMPPEDKMKKRQEIQKQISDLNMQLRQHQMEQRRERQQAKAAAMDDMLGGAKCTKTGNEGTGFSQAGMAAMISAGSSIKQAKAQGSVAAKMDGRAGVLESEIKLDQARGGDTRKKEEELAEVQQKAQAAEASQISTLAEAGRTMEEAAKAESKKETADNKDSKDNKGTKATDREKKNSNQNVSGVDTQGERVTVSESDSTQSATVVSDSTAAETMTHRAVDIRL